MFWNWSRTVLALVLTLGTLLTWSRYTDKPAPRANPAPAPLAALPRPGVLDKGITPAPASSGRTGQASPLRAAGEALFGTAPP